VRIIANPSKLSHIPGLAGLICMTPILVTGGTGTP
jgi:hypothetical protein